MLDWGSCLQVTHNIFHKSQEGSSSPMSTDSSPTSQADTMSVSCGSNPASTLAASLQQSATTLSLSSDNTPSTKLGSLQVMLCPLPGFSQDSVRCCQAGKL